MQETRKDVRQSLIVPPEDVHSMWKLHTSLNLEHSTLDPDITVHSSPQKGGIEPDPAHCDLAAVLSAQPMLQLFPWEA